MNTSKVAIIALLLIIPSTIVKAQTFKATKVQTAALKKQADAMANAMQSQNYNQMLYYTYPHIVKAMGGPEKMSAQLQALTAQMRSRGVSLKSVTIGNMNPIIFSAGDLYSVVPDVVQIVANGTVITRGSSFLAISNDKGLRWYFVDTAPLKGKPLKKLFPTYPDGLVIPDAGNAMPGM